MSRSCLENSSSPTQQRQPPATSRTSYRPRAASATLSASSPASVNSLRITIHSSFSGLLAISRRMAVVLPEPKLPVMTFVKVGEINSQQSLRYYRATSAAGRPRTWQPMSLCQAMAPSKAFRAWHEYCLRYMM
jgi:hypothetical protein